MRVLWIAGQSERYGSDVSLRAAVVGLAARGWEVTVMVPGPGWLADELRSAGIAVVQSHTGVVRRVLRPREWADLLRRLPFDAVRIGRDGRRHDLVHVNSIVVLGGLLGGRISGRPVVCHLRESFAGRPRAWSLYARLLRATSTAMIAVSEDVAAEARTGGLGPITETIHNGVDLTPFLPIGSDNDTGPVVMVGRINDWKGQPDLVEAARLLSERGSPIQVELAGDVFPGGEHYRDNLVDQIERAGLRSSVRLLGYVEDVPALLGRAAVYVQPSARPEPFGIALVEAMAAGRPCVATDAGGPREIIDHGRTGLLVPPRDPGALADAIGRLMSDRDLRRRLGQAARDDVQARFTVTQEVERIDALYRRLLGCDPPR